MLQLEGVHGVGWQGHCGLGVMVLPLHTAMACGCPGGVLGCPPGPAGRGLGCVGGHGGQDSGKAWRDMGWLKTPHPPCFPVV